jgi:hypothetical protein
MKLAFFLSSSDGHHHLRAFVLSVEKLGVPGAYFSTYYSGEKNPKQMLIASYVPEILFLSSPQFLPARALRKGVIRDLRQTFE